MSHQIRAVVMTTAGVIEDRWEHLDTGITDTYDHGNADRYLQAVKAFIAKVDKAIAAGRNLAVVTDEGPLLIPAHAVVWVRCETRET